MLLMFAVIIKLILRNKFFYRQRKVRNARNKIIDYRLKGMYTSLYLRFCSFLGVLIETKNYWLHFLGGMLHSSPYYAHIIVYMKHRIASQRIKSCQRLFLNCFIVGQIFPLPKFLKTCDTGSMSNEASEQT